MNWIGNTSRNRRRNVKSSDKRHKAFFERRRFASQPAYSTAIPRSFCHEDRSRDLVHLECVAGTKRASSHMTNSEEISVESSGDVLGPARFNIQSNISRNQKHVSGGNARIFNKAVHLPNASPIREPSRLEFADATDKECMDTITERHLRPFSPKDPHDRFDQRPPYQSTALEYFQSTQVKDELSPRQGYCEFERGKSSPAMCSETPFTVMKKLQRRSIPRSASLSLFRSQTDHYQHPFSGTTSEKLQINGSALGIVDINDPETISFEGFRTRSPMNVSIDKTIASPNLETSVIEFKSNNVPDFLAESRNLNAQEVAIENENIPMIQSFERSMRDAFRPRLVRGPQTPVLSDKGSSECTMLPFINLVDNLPMPIERYEIRQANNSNCLTYTKADGPDLHAVRNSLEDYMEFSSCRQTAIDNGISHNIGSDEDLRSFCWHDEKHSYTDEIVDATMTQTSITIMPDQHLAQTSNSMSGQEQRQLTDTDCALNSKLKDAFTQTIISKLFADCGTQTDEIVSSDSNRQAKELLHCWDQPDIVRPPKIRRSARLKKSSSF